LVDVGSTEDSTPPGSKTTLADAVTSTVPVTSTSTPTTTSTTIATQDESVRATLEHVGVVPGEPIDRPDDFATLPPPRDYIFDDIPHPRARIASRIEVDEQTVDGSAWNDTGVTITYVPGYTIWDYNGGFREVAVDGGSVFSLNQDGTWTIAEIDELSPFGPFMEWSDVISGYEGALSIGVEVVGYELIAGTETAHIRVEDVRSDLWADLWVDADAVVMRAIVDLDAEEDGPGNGVWLIWDVLTLDPQDIGPLPPSS
jgi:hypothetical protein